MGGLGGGVPLIKLAEVTLPPSISSSRLGGPFGLSAYWSFSPVLLWYSGMPNHPLNPDPTVTLLRQHPCFRPTVGPVSFLR